MKKELMVTANSVQEALASAAKKLNQKEDQLEYEVVCAEKKSLFGRVKRMAQVRVFFQNSDICRTQSVVEKKETYVGLERLPERDAKKIRAAMEYISSIAENLGVTNLEQRAIQQEESVKIELKGEHLSNIIGYRGETLDALQYLVSSAISHLGGEFLRLIIDADGFRLKRDETLRNLARNLAKKVMRSGRRVTLEPMNPYERRILHMEIAKEEEVLSKSVGSEPHRRVMVYPKEAPERVREKRDFSAKKRKAETRIEKKGEFSNQPTTYDFEKEFLKNKDLKIYSKVEIDPKDE